MFFQSTSKHSNKGPSFLGPTVKNIINSLPVLVDVTYRDVTETGMFHSQRREESISSVCKKSVVEGEGVGPLVVTISNRELIFPLQLPAGDTGRH